MTPEEKELLWKIILKMQFVLEGSKFYADGTFKKWEGKEQIEELGNIANEFQEKLKGVKLD
jgi:hypothetical protein